MKKLLLLLLFTAGCQTQKIATKPQPHRIVVQYNDMVVDTLATTDYSYQLGKLEYIEECSCDGTILNILN